MRYNWDKKHKQEFLQVLAFLTEKLNHFFAGGANVVPLAKKTAITAVRLLNQPASTSVKCFKVTKLA